MLYLLVFACISCHYLVVEHFNEKRGHKLIEVVQCGHFHV